MSSPMNEATYINQGSSLTISTWLFIKKKCLAYCEAGLLGSQSLYQFLFRIKPTTLMHLNLPALSKNACIMISISKISLIILVNQIKINSLILFVSWIKISFF